MKRVEKLASEFDDKYMNGEWTPWPRNRKFSVGVYGACWEEGYLQALEDAAKHIQSAAEYAEANQETLDYWAQEIRALADGELGEKDGK